MQEEYKSSSGQMWSMMLKDGEVWKDKSEKPIFITPKITPKIREYLLDKMHKMYEKKKAKEAQ